MDFELLNFVYVA